jgi:hypothetical protein
VSENGRFVPKEVAGTEKTWPATLVLLALGFLGPERGGILDQLVRRGLADDARPGIVVSIATAGDLVQWHPHPRGRGRTARLAGPGSLPFGQPGVVDGSDAPGRGRHRGRQQTGLQDVAM